MRLSSTVISLNEVKIQNNKIIFKIKVAHSNYLIELEIRRVKSGLELREKHGFSLR